MFLESRDAMGSPDNPLSKGSSLPRLKEMEEHRRFGDNVLSGDIWGSLYYTGALESDVQRFLDENPKVGGLSEFPHCAFHGGIP